MAMISAAQDSWKIKLNGKILLSSNAENETKNTKKIKKTGLNNTGSLDIVYKDVDPVSGWKRSLLFFDENDNELIRKDSIKGTTKITTRSLKLLFTERKKIKIYTVSLPADPNLAASVRVRRVHLCTLELL